MDDIDRRHRSRFRLMVTFLASLLAGCVLAVVVFFASPQTQQRLDALPWWAGSVAGLVLAIPVSALAIVLARRNRRRRR